MPTVVKDSRKRSPFWYACFTDVAKRWQTSREREDLCFLPNWPPRDFGFYGCPLWRRRSSSLSIASLSLSKWSRSPMTSRLPGPQPYLHCPAVAAKRYSICCRRSSSSLVESRATLLSIDAQLIKANASKTVSFFLILRYVVFMGRTRASISLSVTSITLSRMSAVTP